MPGKRPVRRLGEVGRKGAVRRPGDGGDPAHRDGLRPLRQQPQEEDQGRGGSSPRPTAASSSSHFLPQGLNLFARNPSSHT
jgi:hypothetical protein